MSVEMIRWVLEDQAPTDPGNEMWPSGWFQVRTSNLHDDEVVMVWARSNDGELEPARVMYRITKFNKAGEALYALRFEED